MALTKEPSPTLWSRPASERGRWISHAPSGTRMKRAGIAICVAMSFAPLGSTAVEMQYLVL